MKETFPVPDGSLWRYVVTGNPKDIPGKVVVRGWVMPPGTTDWLPTNFHVEYPNYTAARYELEQSTDLVCVPRTVDDDPVIIEQWLPFEDDNDGDIVTVTLRL